MIIDRRNLVMDLPFFRRQFLSASFLTVGLVLTGCSLGEKTPDGESDLVARPADDEWPKRFHEAPSEVQEAYRYAATRPAVMQYIPCFCGCVEQGHTCIQDCYVAEFRTDGSVLLDPMSFG